MFDFLVKIQQTFTQNNKCEEISLQQGAKEPLLENKNVE
jgi:hypothetical protein